MVYSCKQMNCWNIGVKLLMHLKMVLFHLNIKKNHAAADDYVLKDVNDFIQEIKSMEEKINLSLFEDFFEFLSPADYAKTLIDIKNADENIGIVAEAKDRISDLKDRIKELKQKKYKNSDETLKIIKKILDYNKDAQKIFFRKLVKENQN